MVFIYLTPVERHLSDFSHVCTFRTPRFIAGRLAYFDLSVWVAFGDIFPTGYVSVFNYDRHGGKSTLHGLPSSWWWRRSSPTICPRWSRNNVSILGKKRMLFFWERESRLAVLDEGWLVIDSVPVITLWLKTARVKALADYVNKSGCWLHSEYRFIHHITAWAEEVIDFPRCLQTITHRTISNPSIQRVRLTNWNRRNGFSSIVQSNCPCHSTLCPTIPRSTVHH